VCVCLRVALLQTGALAAFGAGTSGDPYNAVNNPTEFSKYLGQAFDPDSNPVRAPYLGWCFWMAMVGDLLSIMSGVLFMLAAFCNCCAKDID